jgi:hypothetical protein
MKKCSYCGEECPDDALVCPTDHTPLEGAGTDPDAAMPWLRRLFGMKMLLWLFVATFWAVSGTCWILSSMVINTMVKGFGLPVPAIADLILFPHRGLLFFPVPWLISAVILSRRREVSGRTVLVFAASVAIAIILSLGAVLVALLSFILHASTTSITQ